MASLNHIVLGILILQIYVYGAPNDVSKLEEIANVEQAAPNADQTDPKPNTEPKEVESDDNSFETQRHKRWYNPYGFGYPPFSPFSPPSFTNPSYSKRDDGSNTGYYGGQDPLIEIHRRIQEIHRDIVTQPQLAPPPSHFPIYYPVLFIPPADCNCNTENQNPTTPEPATTDTPAETDGTTTTPSVVNRWPDMEDQRQNWGLVINDTDSEEGIDFNRPISFEPIRLNRPMRPPPPVDHGSVQSDSTNQNRPDSEAPSTTQSPPPGAQPSTTTRPPLNIPQNSQPSGNTPASGLAPPSRCDSAILSCCHQPQFVYDCFVSQGCPDLSGYGYGPCDPNLILRVIERFQAYYGQRYK